MTLYTTPAPGNAGGIDIGDDAVEKAGLFEASKEVEGGILELYGWESTSNEDDAPGLYVGVLKGVGWAGRFEGLNTDDWFDARTLSGGGAYCGLPVIRNIEWGVEFLLGGSEDPIVGVKFKVWSGIVPKWDVTGTGLGCGIGLLWINWLGTTDGGCGESKGCELLAWLSTLGSFTSENGSCDRGWNIENGVLFWLTGFWPTKLSTSASSSDGNRCEAVDSGGPGIVNKLGTLDPSTPIKLKFISDGGNNNSADGCEGGLESVFLWAIVS
jgi:hypothetical protein